MPMRTRSLAMTANLWACTMTANGVFAWAEAGIATTQRMPRAAAASKSREGFLANCVAALRLPRWVPAAWSPVRRPLGRRAGPGARWMGSRRGGGTAPGGRGPGALPIRLDRRRPGMTTPLARPRRRPVAEQPGGVLDPLRCGLRHAGRETITEQVRGDALADLLFARPGDAPAELPVRERRPEPRQPRGVARPR